MLVRLRNRLGTSRAWEMGPGGVGLEGADDPTVSGEEIMPNVTDLAQTLLRLETEVGRAECVLAARLAERDRVASSLREAEAAAGRGCGAQGARTGPPCWRVQALCAASLSTTTEALGVVLESRIVDVESVVQLGAASPVLLWAALDRTACADRDEQRLYQWARERGFNLARNARKAREASAVEYARGGVAAQHDAPQGHKGLAHDIRPESRQQDGIQRDALSLQVEGG